MKLLEQCFALCFAAAVLTSCANQSGLLPADQISSRASQPIIVQRAYDVVFLSVFEVVDSLEAWNPEVTDKNEGTIRVKNIQFGKIGDADTRMLTIEIVRDSKTQTQIRLDQDSQRVIGASDVMDAIRSKLGVSA